MSVSCQSLFRLFWGIWNTDKAVDDSYQNCKSAQQLGWTAAHLVEDDVKSPKTPASQYQIRHLVELRKIYPQFFKPEEAEANAR